MLNLHLNSIKNKNSLKEVMRSRKSFNVLKGQTFLKSLDIICKVWTILKVGTFSESENVTFLK